MSRAFLNSVLFNNTKTEKGLGTGIETKVVDLGLLADDNEHPIQWKEARILDMYPGNCASVRCQNSEVRLYRASREFTRASS